MKTLLLALALISPMTTPAMATTYDEVVEACAPLKRQTFRIPFVKANPLGTKEDRVMVLALHRTEIRVALTDECEGRQMLNEELYSQPFLPTSGDNDRCSDSPHDCFKVHRALQALMKDLDSRQATGTVAAEREIDQAIRCAHARLSYLAEAFFTAYPKYRSYKPGTRLWVKMVFRNAFGH